MFTDRPLTLTVDQTARLLGISRSTAYELVQSGELECLRLRRRERIGRTIGQRVRRQRRQLRAGRRLWIRRQLRAGRRRLRP